MVKLEREFISGIKSQQIKDIVNTLEKSGFEVEKSHIHDWEDYQYRLFAEYELRDDGKKQLKSLVVEVEDKHVFLHTI